MRKVFGGVVVDSNLKEIYCVSLVNDDGSMTHLAEETFDRKKPYGVDFVIETAQTALESKGLDQLTEDEISWLRTAGNEELQELILSLKL